MQNLGGKKKKGGNSIPALYPPGLQANSTQSSETKPARVEIILK